MIKTVTITGADDSINPEELLEISDKYPFVELGILISRNSIGLNRFPSKKWLDKLDKLATTGKTVLNLSCHLCGGYVRELLMGKDVFALPEFPISMLPYGRVQINTHGMQHEFSTIYMPEMLRGYCGPDSIGLEFIFQYDNVNTQPLLLAIKNEVTCSALFDMSHGAGLLQKNWPKPLSGIKCGYAGGLSAENIVSQIEAIEQKIWEVSDPLFYEYWIDMETHVRSNDDKQFDLTKVKKCLELAKPYVIGQ